MFEGIPMLQGTGGYHRVLPPEVIKGRADILCRTGESQIARGAGDGEHKTGCIQFANGHGLLIEPMASPCPGAT
jgi:hypothetical protein